MTINTQSNSLKQVQSALLSTGAIVLVDEPMSKYTTFRIGGPADLFYIANTTEQLVNAVIICREYEVPVFILGGGSNILVSDAGIRGVTIKNQTQTLSIENEFVTVASGYSMPKFAREVSKYGLTGCEFMQTIPGTIGGGIHQNARFRHPQDFGAYKGFLAAHDIYVGQLVDTVSILSSNNNAVELSNKECQFIYEGFFCSGFQDTADIIISARLRFQHDAPDKIRKRLSMYASYRNKRTVYDNGQEIAQPLDLFTGTRPEQPIGATAGCVFFNSSNSWDHPTGRMIDMCGLKGRRIGDAQISPKHANYIVNLGQARAEDVYVLMELCKSAVWEKFGVELVNEIQLVGEWHKDTIPTVGGI